MTNSFTVEHPPWIQLSLLLDKDENHIRAASAQEKFDHTYISSVEIMELLNVSRTAISQARQRGMLPAPILSHNGSMVLWERHTLIPVLQVWKLMLDIRRKQAS
jgi:hypothetical protein